MNIYNQLQYFLFFIYFSQFAALGLITKRYRNCNKKTNTLGIPPEKNNVLPVLKLGAPTVRRIRSMTTVKIPIPLRPTRPVQQ